MVKDKTAIIYYFFSMINSKIEKGLITQTTTVVTIKRLAHCQCKHTNITRFIPITNDLQSSQPKINKSTTTEQNNTLVRITQIEFPGFKYELEDIYLFNSLIPTAPDLKGPDRDPSTVPSATQNIKPRKLKRRRTKIKRSSGGDKKICLFQKVAKDQAQFLKRNTKNIPKNFCKAFVNYLSSEPKQIKDLDTLFEDFRRLQEATHHKYNNHFLSRLVSHPRLSLHFRIFLEHYASTWIKKSRVTDKEIHSQAITIYLDLINKASVPKDLGPTE